MNNCSYEVLSSELVVFLIKLTPEMVDVWYLVTEVEQPGVKVQVGQLANTLCSLVVQAGIEQVATSSKLDQPVLPSRDL